MSYGLRIENEAGVLAVDSNARGYHYVGQPTLITAGVNSGGLMSTYVYRITMPNSTDPPAVAVKLQSSVVSLVASVSLYSGTTWQIDVFSWARSNCDNKLCTAAAPSLYVFGPAAAGGSSYGLQLFSSSGALAWNFNTAPLFGRQLLSWAAKAGARTQPGAVWTGDGVGFWNSGQAMALDTAINAPAIVGSPAGEWVETQSGTGNVVALGVWGWVLNGSNVERVRCWVETDNTSYNQAGTNPANYVANPNDTLIVSTQYL